MQKAWDKYNITVEEGINQLNTLCSMEVKVKDNITCLKIPKPREQSEQLFEALDIHLPVAHPHRNLKADTRKKLTDKRKTKNY